jgi:hypothetical protein
MTSVVLAVRDRLASDSSSERSESIARYLSEPARREFWTFVCERQAVWHRRFVDGLPPPWTQDPILRVNRFTNVYRELDPGTQYAVKSILERRESVGDRVFNIMIYRLIGRKETHRAIGFVRLRDFDATALAGSMHAVQRAGVSPFTGAYLVAGYSQMGSTDKILNVSRLFARIAHEYRSYSMTMRRTGSLRELYSTLLSVPGFGNFLAYQVAVDLTYPLKALNGSALFPHSQEEWAAAGPGAKKGIAVIRGNRVGPADLDVMTWLRDNQEMEFKSFGLHFPYLLAQGGSPLPISLPNIQNCLCEFYKYDKITKGKGRSRRRFQPPIPDNSLPC